MRGMRLQGLGKEGDKVEAANVVYAVKKMMCDLCLFWVWELDFFRNFNSITTGMSLTWQLYEQKHMQKHCLENWCMGSNNEFSCVILLSIHLKGLKQSREKCADYKVKGTCNQGLLYTQWWLSMSNNWSPITWTNKPTYCIIKTHTLWKSL